MDLVNLIKINLELVKKTKTKLLELANIAREEKYNEDSVIEKIKELNNYLRQLNSLPENFSKNYKAEYNSWIEESEKNENRLNAYMKPLYAKYDADDERFGEKIDLLNNAIEKMNSKEFKDASDAVFKVDVQKITSLLSKQLFRKFSRQRKWIGFLANIVFRFRVFLLKFIAALISFLVTTLAALFLGLSFEPSSEILISFILFLLSFFILDKMISKRSGKIFWYITRAQTFILANQLSVYVNQLSLITSFMKKNIS